MNTNGLKDLPYIHFSQTAEDAAQTVPGMMELTGTRFPADEFRTKYAELIKFI